MSFRFKAEHFYIKLPDDEGYSDKRILPATAAAMANAVLEEQGQKRENPDEGKRVQTSPGSL